SRCRIRAGATLPGSNAIPGSKPSFFRNCANACGWFCRGALRAPAGMSPALEQFFCDWNHSLSFIVMPAKAGIHKHKPVIMDAGFRRHDSQGFDAFTNRKEL